MNTIAKKHRRITDAQASSPMENMPLLLLRATLKGSVAAILSMLILSLAAVMIAYWNADPDALLTPLALGVLAISATIAGFVTWRSSRVAPLLCGALCGCTLLLLFFFFSCFLPDQLRSSFSTGLLWGLRGGVLLFCVLGAIMASNMPKGRRNKRKTKR